MARRILATDRIGEIPERTRNLEGSGEESLGQDLHDQQDNGHVYPV